VKKEDLVVKYKGKDRFLLNGSLIEAQDCLENLEEIKNLHVKRFEIEERMKDKSSDMLALDKEWTENQFSLQDAWKFKRNKNFHRFWRIPSCKCPRMDNEDNYPYGRYAITSACGIHWPSFVEERKEENEDV